MRNTDSWVETITILLDEVTAEKNATEPTQGEDIGRYERLDELETYLQRALEFAEETE